jgi:hypothetical protein
MRRMDSRLFWRAALVQALLVGIVFAILAVLPLGDDFFEDYGWISGPLAWILCALATGRVLSLPLDLTLFAAAAGCVAGALVALVTSHTIGLIVGVAVFGASCAGYEAARDAEDADGGGPPSEPRRTTGPDGSAA